MANTSLVSETLLTERAILSDALQAYTCTYSYYACKYVYNMYIHVHIAIMHVNIHVFFYGILQHLEPSFHVISITKV